MTTSDRPAMRTADRVFYVAMICVWTVPWMVLSVIMFAPWLAPSLFSPVNGFWLVAGAMYLADGLMMPLILLMIGLSLVTTGRRWQWLLAWTATVAAGFGFEYATLPFLMSMFRARDKLAGHWNWQALAWGGGFALLAVTAGLLLAGWPGRDPARRGTGWA